jgi:hypothetical protein
MFECELASAPELGKQPDAMQTGIEWLDLRALSQYRLYPKVLRQILASGEFDGKPIYLGDIN